MPAISSLGDLGNLMWILHTKGRKILTFSLGTSGRSPFYQTNHIVIAPRRRGKVTANGGTNHSKLVIR
jgi:hypothetical protein